MVTARPSDQSTLDQIFKAYDVRGTVPDQLNATVCRAVGAAFARFAASDRLLVARDMRSSGDELSAAFADGVTAQGVDVVDLGLCSTDLIYYAAGKLDAPGAMFTASHNPANYNGIKFCLSGARPVGEDTGLGQIKQEAREILDGRGPKPAAQPGARSTQDLLDDYARHVRSFAGDLAALKPLRVVADTANGMGGLVVPKVFAELPFHLTVLYGELDGTFPNHPADPIQPENLRDLQAAVTSTGADIGLAFDGDADRVFLVDETGQALSGSTTTAMLAAEILRTHPGETVIYNVVCSKAVPEIVLESGGVPVRSRVGHSFIKALMAETGAIFGGEHSAHYYFRDNFRADSGLIASMMVLALLSRVRQPLSSLRKGYERYADSGEINTRVGDPHAVMDKLAAAYGGSPQDRLDGLTVDLDGWWFNVRPSNTEPLLRLNVEAGDPDACRRHTDEVLALIRENA
jgi:phosphomannomutase